MKEQVNKNRFGNDKNEGINRKGNMPQKHMMKGNHRHDERNGRYQKKKNYASIIYRDKKYNIQREKDTEWEL